MAVIQYPRWVYHPTNPPILVQTAADEARLPSGFIVQPPEPLKLATPDAAIVPTREILDASTGRHIDLHNTNSTPPADAINAQIESACWCG